LSNSAPPLAPFRNLEQLPRFSDVSMVRGMHNDPPERGAETAATAQRPLAGIRVAEFCSTAAGPFCAMLLADMGAEVVKVESPEGDGLRQWPPLTDGYSENFASVNRNKKSVALNLKDPAGAEVARRLILDSDVVVENNRPGVMERLGLGYAQLRELHPALVYCSISAFGQSGPRASEGGFDLTIQAAAGVMSVTGDDSGAPAKCGVPVSDFASGLYGAYAVASALHTARATGAGVHIDVPMFGCTLAIAALQTSEYFGTGRSPRRMGSAHPRNAPYRAFEASDGYFAIAAGNHALWLKVLAVVGMPQLADDPRFKSTLDRATHQADLKVLLEARFREAPVAHWLRSFRDAGVPHSAINDYATALEDAQVEAMGWLHDLPLPNGATTRTFGSPLRLDGRTSDIRRGPPALGEHTDEILARYGERVQA
jgi:crotonobetainyl-CoA:carnitine CoA-transferase CaiB-like acyl-CoA transferase